MLRVRDTNWAMHAALLFLLYGAGCGVALRRHTMNPYADDPTAAAKVEADATRICTARGKPIPPRPFRVDGCTLFPDGNWGECCKDHDIDYWCGGSYLDRLRTDARLGRCVACQGPPVIGQLLGVFLPLGAQVGGLSVLPTWFRWGYGHPSRLECHFDRERGCPTASVP
jgi:hypothetical protein